MARDELARRRGLDRPEINTVGVIGYWEGKHAMRDCLASPDHSPLIQEFAEHFAAVPEVTSTQVAPRVGAIAA